MNTRLTQFLIFIIASISVLTLITYNFFQAQAQQLTCFPDFSPDGQIGSDEFLYVMTHWGETCPSVPSPTPTPPSTCGNQICQPGEYVPCPTGSNCIWAGSCPQDCLPDDNLVIQCQQAGGTLLPEFNECEGINQSTCQELGGTFTECASPCRHDPNYPNIVCIQICVPVCSFPNNSDF